jgi:hypothetical protein
MQLERILRADTRRCLELGQCSKHVPQPGVTLRRPYDEGGVAHAQSGVPSFLAVGRRPAPVLHQEECKVTGRLMEVVRIERAEQGVTSDAQVEPVDQVDEEHLAAHPLVQCGVHGVESRGFILLRDSRP